MSTSEATPAPPAAPPPSQAPAGGAGRHGAAPPPAVAAPAGAATAQATRTRLPSRPSIPDAWTLLLAGAVLLAAAFTLIPALWPHPRVPTVTRVALPGVTVPVPTGAGEPPTYPTTTSVTPLISGRVNLNTATPEQLEALPKVGPALAARIVAGRPYRSLEDLDRVKGVGPAALKTLGPLVTF